MLSTVSFNNESFFKRHKINDPWTDRHLSTKLQAGKLAAPQQLPEHKFRIGQIATEAKRLLPFHFGHAMLQHSSPLTRRASRATLSHEGERVKITRTLRA
jgi:hypothetical protein